MRPFCLPAACLPSGALVPVEPGSIPYSAVSHPCPRPASQRGTPSSIVAVQRTRVFPKEMSAEPCACSRKSRHDLERPAARHAAGPLASVGSRQEPTGRASFARCERRSRHAFVRNARGRSRYARSGMEARGGPSRSTGGRSRGCPFELVERRRPRPGRSEAGGSARRARGTRPASPWSGTGRSHRVRGVVLDALARRASRRPRAPSPRPRRRASLPPEGALEHGADERVVRAAEDDGVDPGALQRRGVLPHRLDEAPRRPPGRPRSEARASGRRPRSTRRARVERQDGAACSGRSRRSPRSRAAPIRRFRVAWTAARASGARTPTTGTASRYCSVGSAAAVAELQAATISLTPSSRRYEAISSAKRRISRCRPGPVRAASAVAQVDEVLVRHRDEALVEHGQPTRSRVEDPDRPLVHRRRFYGWAWIPAAWRRRTRTYTLGMLELEGCRRRIRANRGVPARRRLLRRRRHGTVRRPLPRLRAVDGASPDFPGRIRRSRARSRSPPAGSGRPTSRRSRRGAFRIGRWSRTWEEEGYAAAVDAAREAIARGDVYQVNLVQHLHAPFAGDPAGARRRCLAVLDPLAPRPLARRRLDDRVRLARAVPGAPRSSASGRSRSRAPGRPARPTSSRPRRRTRPST